jgi:pimeloyl-ACP methyl ester carboxylesterase
MAQTKELLHYKIYDQSPNKEWLVFIHGAGGSIATWKHQVAAFKPYFKLLLLDLRDHGQSKNIYPEYENYNFEIVASDILKVIDHLGIQKAHFMSLSLGSVILQKLEIKRPELIDKMIMAGGVFRANFKIKLFVHLAKFLNYFLPYRMMYNIFSWVILPRKNHAHSRRIFRLQSQKLNQKEYLKWVGLYKDFFHLLKNYFKKEMQSLSLVIMGAEDHVFFEAAKNFVAHHKKNAQLVIFEKCGHICNIEEYEKFNNTVLSFLLGPSHPIEKPALSI